MRLHLKMMKGILSGADDSWHILSKIFHYKIAEFCSSQIHLKHIYSYTCIYTGYNYIGW